MTSGAANSGVPAMYFSSWLPSKYLARPKSINFIRFPRISHIIMFSGWKYIYIYYSEWAVMSSNLNVEMNNVLLVNVAHSLAQLADDHSHRSFWQNVRFVRNSVEQFTSLHSETISHIELSSSFIEHFHNQTDIPIVSVEGIIDLCNSWMSKLRQNAHFSLDFSSVCLLQLFTIHQQSYIISTFVVEKIP